MLDLQDDASLLLKLDEAILDAACARFAVRREWMDGADLQAHLCHDFYKDPKGFAVLLETLKQNNPDGELNGILVAPLEKERDAEALLILQESIGFIGEKPIYRYHLCNNWSFSYWKSRAYLTACIAIAWKHEVYVHGIFARKKVIEKLSEGKTLLGWQGDGMWSLGIKRWHPEDMALRPEIYLNGLDPEQDNFGIVAGLQLWLELENKGLMNTGVDESARPQFQQELAKYQIASQSMDS
ncbi:hypothetical protein D3878_14565 [Noviherbaspirillum sedimenti]|uniref:Uncharacterized protein n=2 Tax=Noviherbaspirillum sedimenti TaxID=2320865 RepID=A0A3A3G2F6_9BURK|nr:hypothetical protein D3878_14565 [Noviherbaspirillum sedimenti]